MLRSCVVMMLFAFSSSAWAQATKRDLTAYPIQLLRGVDAGLSAPKGNCVRFRDGKQSRVRPIPPPAGSQQYTERWVTSSEQLDSFLNLSAQIELSTMFADGSAGFDYLKKSSNVDRSIAWVINAVFEREEELADTALLELTPEAKSTLNSPNGGLEVFYTMCGTQFWVSEVRGAQYTLIYNFDGLKRDELEQMKANADFNYEFASGSSKLDRFLHRAYDRQVMHIETHIVGGDADTPGGEKADGGLVDRQTIVNGIQHLKQFVFTQGAGHKIRGTLSEYTVFPEIALAVANQGKTMQFDIAIRKYLSLWRSINERLRERQLLLVGAQGAEPYWTLAPSDRSRVEAEREKLGQAGEAVRKQALRCLKSQECEYENLQIPTLMDLPDKTEDLSTLQGWNVELKVYARREAFGARFRVSVPSDSPYNGKAGVRIFDAGDKLEVDESGHVFARLDRLNGNGSIQPDQKDERIFLGTVDNVDDGGLRPSLCLGEPLAHHCNLRIVKLKSSSCDSAPGIKLQFSIYDEFGFNIIPTADLFATINNVAGCPASKSKPPSNCKQGAWDEAMQVCTRCELPIAPQRIAGGQFTLAGACPMMPRYLPVKIETKVAVTPRVTLTPACNFGFNFNVSLNAERLPTGNIKHEMLRQASNEDNVSSIGVQGAGSKDMRVDFYTNDTYHQCPGQPNPIHDNALEVSGMTIIESVGNADDWQHQ